MSGTSAGRVPANTSLDVDLRITEQLRQNIAYYTRNPAQIPERLKELDREWDVERILATGSSSLSIFGLLMGLTGRNRRWFALPLLVQGFSMQHMLRGWSPPLPVLRQLGFRTAAEIERESSALKELLREMRPGGGSTAERGEDEEEGDGGDRTVLH